MKYIYVDQPFRLMLNAVDPVKNSTTEIADTTTMLTTASDLKIIWKRGSETGEFDATIANSTYFQADVTGAENDTAGKYLLHVSCIPSGSTTAVLGRKFELTILPKF